MKLHARNAAWLLPLVLSGCVHKHQPAPAPLAPPIVDTPPPPPQPAAKPADLPPPVVSVPAEQKPSQPAPQQTAPKPTPRHHRATQQPKPAPPPAPAAEVSAVGQLAPGESSDLRRQTESTIAETDRGLHAITRSLSAQEEKTAAQIREFLKQANAALSSGDIDGAHTLALKARVLLGELSH